MAYDHIVIRESGYIAGWFDGEPPASFVAECNANVPGDPARAEYLDPAEWDKFLADNPAENTCSTCGPLDHPGVHSQPGCTRSARPAGSPEVRVIGPTAYGDSAVLAVRDGRYFVVVTSTAKDTAVQTHAFPADESGRVRSWSEVLGGYGQTRESVLADLGRRYAIVRTPRAEQVSAYLPSNYQILARLNDGVVIAGHDRAGWTMDGYVLPRLASGLIFGGEVGPQDARDAFNDDEQLDDLMPADHRACPTCGCKGGH